jgi:Fur family zinc uptake transcriptional regulator
MGRQPQPATNQEEVLSVLRGAGVPLTAYQVLKLLRPDRVWAPTTVYRALQRLIDAGLVHRVESINAYVVCSHPHHGSGTAMFAICQGCGRVDEIAESHHMEQLKNFVGAHRFCLERATIELTGYCVDCASRLSPKSTRPAAIALHDSSTTKQATVESAAS